MQQSSGDKNLSVKMQCNDNSYRGIDLCESRVCQEESF